MTIKEIHDQLDKADAPIVKVLQRAEHFKVIALGLKKDITLKEHKTGITTKLVVIEGAVTYKEAERSVVLHKFDELDIPLNIIHSVTAQANSICLLIQG